MRRALEARPNIEVTGESRNGWSAIQLTCATQPDVALIGRRLPRVDGLEVLGEIRGAAPGVRVIFVSSENSAPTVHEAVSAGADGFLSTAINERELCEYVHRCAAGQKVISLDLQSALLDHIRNNGSHAGGLSKREREILRLVAEGRSARAIGETLHLSPTTVRTYARRSYEKLGVRTQAAAIAAAFRLGILK